MKIVVLAKEFPNTVYPVACNFIYDQAYALSNFECVFVVAPVYSFPNLNRYSQIRKLINTVPILEKIGNLTIYRPRYRYYPSIFRRIMMSGFIKTAHKTILKNIGSFDILHTHFLQEAGYAGIALSKQFNVPLVVTAHGGDVNRYLLGRGCRQYEMNRARQTLKSADAVISVSNYIERSLRKYCGESTKIRHIYNGVDTSVFKPADKSTMRSLLSLPQDKKIILFVGNILREKGVFDLLESLKIVGRKRCDVLAVFVGSDKTNDQFEHECRRSDNVVYHGVIAHDKIAYYMQSADLLVLPSYSEGFGLVIVESLACGCPVVATNIGSIPEIITSPRLGTLVECSNIPKIAEEIELALNTAWNKEELLCHAEKFSQKISITNIRNLYKELIA